MSVGTSYSVLPSPGVNCTLQISVQSGGPFYLNYDPADDSPYFGFTTRTDAASNITIDTTNHYLYVPYSGDTQFAVPYFYDSQYGQSTFTTANPADSQLDNPFPAQDYPLQCAQGAYLADGRTAPVTCSVPGTGFDKFAACGGLLYAYNSTFSDTSAFCFDPFGPTNDATVTAFTAVCNWPAPAPTSSRGLFSSGAASCSVTLRLFTETITSWVTAGATRPEAVVSSAAPNVISGTTFGCVPVTRRMAT